MAGSTVEERVAHPEEHSRGYAQVREEGRRFEKTLSRRIHALDQKFSRWFARLTGILITRLLAQIGLPGTAPFAR